MHDAWATCGPSEVAAPVAHSNRRYTLSIATVVVSLLILWSMRPPFVTAPGKGTRAAHLLFNRVLVISLLAGALVLVIPASRPVLHRIQRVVGQAP